MGHTGPFTMAKAARWETEQKAAAWKLKNSQSSQG